MSPRRSRVRALGVASRGVVWLGVVSFGFAAAALAGCGEGTRSVTGFCAGVESVAADPTGRWGVTSACQVPYARTTSDDWCSKLVYDQSGVRDGLFLGNEFLQLQKGSTITFETPPGPPCGPPGTCGSYSASLIFAGKTTTVFPLGCLRQHMANPTCQDLQKKMEDLIQLNVLPIVVQNSLSCVDASDGDGCACTYDVSTAQTAADLGSWRIDDNHLVTYPGMLALAGVVDFFVESNPTYEQAMHLHGHDGLPLLAHDPLRTLNLVKCNASAIAEGLCPAPQ